MGLVLVRYGEIALKGKNRAEFVRRLRRNMRDALKRRGCPGRVWSEGQRVYVETDQVDEALEALRHVFGIVSLSPVVEVPPDLEAMKAEAVRQALAAGLGPGRSYHIAARRADKTFPLTSPEINRVLGAAVQEATGARVDLSDAADVVIGVEVQRDRVLLYGRVVPGWGGMPVLSQGRVVALLSGGIDSVVAAWLVMKRGCGVIPIHFYQNETEKAKVLDLCARLQDYSAGFAIRPVIVDHGEVLGDLPQRLRAIGQERWTCIFCKRAMLQKAWQIAGELGASAIVMGDSLGQVASQTLENMRVISHGLDALVLRPLVGYDKAEVVALARRIGTYDISARAAEGCRFLPPNPMTRASVEGLRQVLEELGEVPPTHALP
ncbi:MAG: tRNA uracil 4-sulfurtransferase ThiI [Anaerolineae bacterium]